MKCSSQCLPCLRKQKRWNFGGIEQNHLISSTRSSLEDALAFSKFACLPMTQISAIYQTRGNLLFLSTLKASRSIWLWDPIECGITTSVRDPRNILTKSSVWTARTHLVGFFHERLLLAYEVSINAQRLFDSPGLLCI